MGIAEKIYELIKELPEEVAREVLDFAQARRKQLDAEREERRRAASAVLDKHRGKFKVEKFDRDELHDREKLR